MNFNDLMAKMRELDQPAVAEAQVEECGEPMGMNAPVMNSQPPHTPPSLSINLNAQGMDDIESIMKLMTKVNPDMINQPMPAAPAVDPMAMLTPPGPSISSIGDLGNLDSGPLKMLPDLSDEPEGDVGGSDGVSKAMGDLDGDGDHDMDDHEMEKDKPEDSMDKPDGDAMNKDDEEKQDEWANTPTGFGVQDGPEVKDIDYMVNKISGGMGKQQNMYKHNYRGGDNPMSMKEDELRAYVKSELTKRLAEAKSKQGKI